MELVIAKPRPKAAIGKTFLKGIRFTLASADNNYKPLTPGKKLYLYVSDDGALNTYGGLFAKDVTHYLSEEIFKDQSNYLYSITEAPNILKGSRIDPTFLEITKVVPEEDGVLVTGILHNARDPRIPFLDRAEKSEFGVGEFKLDDMVALYDGSFFHLSLSKQAEEIEKVIEEQKSLFKQYSLDNDEDTKKALEHTHKVLKPFAYEIFKIEDDLVSFVTKSGKWQAINLAGNRKLDLWDKERIYNFAEKKGLLDSPDLLAEAKRSFYKKPMQERFDLEDLAPILLDEVLATWEKDKVELNKLIDSSASKKPTDGLDPIPGLNEGVEFLPHQSYIIAKTRDRDRQLIDADAGCFAVGTPILMFDGSIKAVEDIVVGDQVMGPDSLPRNVLSLCRGREKMYKVIPVKGDPWVCNESHVLSIKFTPNRDNNYVRGGTANITVKDYLEKSSMYKSKAKLWRTGIDFPHKEQSMDPYFAGLWFGDGSLNKAEITNMDPEIEEYLTDYAQAVGMRLNISKSGSKPSKAKLYRMCAVTNKKHNNFIRIKTKEWSLTGTKIIPDEYIYNSFSVRCQFLAGLIDTDGHFHHGYYEISVKNKDMAESVLFIARSLGLAAYMKKRMIKYTYNGVTQLRPHHRITISGHTNIIPCKIARKVAPPRVQIKDVCVTGFSLEELPEDEFYGFTLDKDSLFLLGDFTVTHNSGKTILIIADVLHQIAKDRVKRPLVIMPNNLVSQFALEVRNFSSLNPWIITSETLKTWGKGYKDDKFSKMLLSAKEAPVNTLFITSYHFLSAIKKLVDNGQIVEEKGRQVYRQTKTFPNAYRLLNELGVDAVYMDESHTLKNDSNFTKASSVFSKVSQVKGYTGTIMPGNLIDVLGPMGIIQSSVLGSAKDFVEKHSATKSINSYHKTAPKDIRNDLQRFGTPQVRSTAWGAVMPKVHREYHYISFNTTQQKFYEAYLNNTIEDIKNDPTLSKYFQKFNLDLEEEDAVMHPALRAKFIPLDVFLNSPGEAEKYLGASLTGDDAMSPKVEEINAICSKHLGNSSNGKIIIFVQYKEAGKNLLKHLDPNLKPKAEYYEGGMIEVLNRFKNPDSNLKILIGVDSTLRMGHNLQVANCIIHADTLWLNGDMRQREARANRLKQKREVFIHHVVIHNSHELLKNARLLSQEHTIAKANSDFDDSTMLPHVEMTLEGMSTFRSIDKIEPFMSRQKKIEEFSVKQTKVDKEFYGTHILPPHGYEELSVGTKLAIVPSTETFEGNRNDSTYIIEEELETMKWETDAPKLSFNLQNWDDNWFLTVFKSADPNGFVRRLGFMLQPAFYYKEVSSKGGVSGLIEDIEEGGIEILNKDSLQEGVAKARLLHPSRMGTLKRLEQEGRKAVSGKVSIKYQVEFFFASIDGYPYVMSDNVKIGSKEGQILKKKGFQQGEPFWYLPIRRSALVTFLKKLEGGYPGIKIARWDEFKEVAKGIFGIDLKEFDEMGV